MASSASRAGQVVIVVHVAVGADSRRVGVRVGERETHAGVIEFGAQPGIGAVARFARRGETGGHVVRAGGALKVARVAGIALRG